MYREIMIMRTNIFSEFNQRIMINYYRLYSFIHIILLQITYIIFTWSDLLHYKFPPSQFTLNLHDLTYPISWINFHPFVGFLKA